MVSLRSALIAAAALVAGVQADYFIEPSSVPISTRKSWCDSQRTQCLPICLDFAPGSGRTIENSCNPDTLSYSCICGNNQSPNLTEYSLTMPYHKCIQYQRNCVTKCGASNNVCSGACMNDIKCGALSPKGANASVSATTSGSAATSTGSQGAGETNSFGSNGGAAGPPGSLGTQSASLHTSLSLAFAITGILIAPLLL